VKSLRVRIVLLVGGFGVVVAVILGLILQSSLRSYYVDVLSARTGDFVDRLIETQPDLWNEYLRAPEVFSYLLRGYVAYSPSVGLYLLDAQGRILSSSGERKDHWSGYEVEVKKIQAAFAADPRLPIFADDPDAQGVRCLVVVRPLRAGADVAGWLFAVERAAQEGVQPPEMFRAYAFRTALQSGLVTLGVGMALTIAMIALLTKPLIRLTRVAGEIERSGFSGDIDDASFPHSERDDEIGRLSRAFHEMYVRLKREMQRCVTIDVRRREMIASVSHDLRTPLTALTAQLETIRIKGATLDNAGRRKLHEQALHNAGQLRRLTDALAELAKLDSPEFHAQLEALSIGELADDVVQRFAARAAELKIRLSLDYPDGLPLPRADAELIERALSNLLDNALRVTPAGGTVEVRVGRRPGALRIAVIDSGPGVALEDQPRVFELFYQATRHRDARGSSGLGLAIVRRVAELHGGHAGLTSQPGSGAAFYIDLPDAFAGA